MIDWNQCGSVERDPAKVSGAWVFKGTRVPVRSLFENLEDGATIDEYLAWFPGVARDQAEAVLEHAAHFCEAAPMSQAWLDEIQRRSAQLDAGDVKTVSWETVRDEALLRARARKGMM